VAIATSLAYGSLRDDSHGKPLTQPIRQHPEQHQPATRWSSIKPSRWSRAKPSLSTGPNATKLESLLLRLDAYGTGGTLSHIADKETTVAADAPMVLFDFTGLSDRLAPALTLAVADYVEWQVHILRVRKRLGELDGLGRWAGNAELIVEEGWKPLASPAAGAWLNE
jgi:hypothetical protein